MFDQLSVSCPSLGIKHQPIFKYTATTILITLLLVVFCNPVSAAEEDATKSGDCDIAKLPVAENIQAKRLSGPVDLDGLLLESDWQQPSESRFVQNDPNNGCAPRQKTEFWVGYDNSAIYIAARMWESAPDSIDARLGRRDTWPTSDWLYINLDTFNDDRTAFSFSINPLGVIGDSALYNDGWGDSSWDGVWDAKTQITDDSWTVEARIPFSQLKFPDTQDQVWGINVSRRTNRFHERDELFHNPRGGSGYGCRFPDLVGISGIEPKPVTELRFYGLAKGEFLEVDENDPFQSDSEFSFNAGVDAKVGLSNNLTLNATINPDFGQVEVDPAVVNLSDYETFLPEQRPFFVADANMFRFGREGLNSNWGFNWMDPMLFYSRRVGRAPQLSINDDPDLGSPDFVDRPQNTTILGAAKIGGKIGNVSVGGMTAVTAREYAELDTDGTRSEQVVEPLTNYSVARAKVENDAGTRALGLMATSTIRNLDDPVSQKELDRRALTGGIDGWSYLDEDKVWAIKGYLTGSYLTGSNEAISAVQTSSGHRFQRPDAQHLNYDPDATSMKGWAGRVAINKQSGNWRLNSAAGYISPGYEINDIGYLSRSDVINTSIVGGYRWLEPNNVFRNQALNLAAYKVWDTNGRPDQYGAGLFYWGQLANFWGVDFDCFYNPERNSNRMTRGGPIVRMPAAYSGSLSINTDWRKQVVGSLTVGGENDDGGNKSAYIRGSVEVNPTSALNVSFRPRYSWEQNETQYYTSFEDEYQSQTFGNRYIFADLEYRSFSLETRIDWTFTTNLSLQAYIQPLFASGKYSDLKELKRPGSYDFTRYGQDNGSSIVDDSATDPDEPWLITPDGSIAHDFRLSDNSFNFKSLKVNMVLRWEYSPGSTFFFVWTQDRANFDDPGSFDLGRDAKSLMDAPGEDIFMVKISQYFSL